MNQLDAVERGETTPKSLEIRKIQDGVQAFGRQWTYICAGIAVSSCAMVITALWISCTFCVGILFLGGVSYFASEGPQIAIAPLIYVALGCFASTVGGIFVCTPGCIAAPMTKVFERMI